ncbi:unnamed protein product [Caenorhabditis auriculariae]|uniref:Uncharacterized protein n=1 Tax=Caenorhabditis auriculariae TaxID=2777116 RepID=A0A8S1HU79_9PELO|nr:unnamed protein product [Caenorhabditis auriculariae]
MGILRQPKVTRISSFAMTNPFEPKTKGSPKAAPKANAAPSSSRKMPSKTVPKPTPKLMDELLFALNLQTPLTTREHCAQLEKILADVDLFNLSYQLRVGTKGKEPTNVLLSLALYLFGAAKHVPTIMSCDHECAIIKEKASDYSITVSYPQEDLVLVSPKDSTQRYVSKYMVINAAALNAPSLTSLSLEEGLSLMVHHSMALMFEDPSDVPLYRNLSSKSKDFIVDLIRPMIYSCPESVRAGRQIPEMDSVTLSSTVNYYIKDRIKMARRTVPRMRTANLDEYNLLRDKYLGHLAVPQATTSSISSPDTRSQPSPPEDSASQDSAMSADEPPRKVKCLDLHGQSPHVDYPSLGPSSRHELHGPQEDHLARISTPASLSDPTGSPSPVGPSPWQALHGPQEDHLARISTPASLSDPTGSPSPVGPSSRHELHGPQEDHLARISTPASLSDPTGSPSPVGPSSRHELHGPQEDHLARISTPASLSDPTGSPSPVGPSPWQALHGPQEDHLARISTPASLSDPTGSPSPVGPSSRHELHGPQEDHLARISTPASLSGTNLLGFSPKTSSSQNPTGSPSPVGPSPWQALHGPQEDHLARISTPASLSDPTGSPSPVGPSPWHLYHGHPQVSVAGYPAQQHTFLTELQPVRLSRPPSSAVVDFHPSCFGQVVDAYAFSPPGDAFFAQPSRYNDHPHN